MKNFSSLAILAAGTMALSTPASAEQFYGFMDINVNYLDWTEKAEDRTAPPHLGGEGFGGTKEDFFYLELEGGAGFDWGDLYGFVDFENPGESRSKREFGFGDFDTPESDGIYSDSFRIAAKGSIAYNIGETKFNYYGHIYSLTVGGEGFYDQNIVLGASYDIFTDWGFWMKPFLGIHIELSTFNGSGTNGYMGGWVLGYDFQLADQKFSINQWHETEFARKDQFRGNGTQYQLNSTGQNGAVSAWWHMTKHFTTGIQYRYADHKLGTAAYHDAIIYTLKYNF